MRGIFRQNKIHAEIHIEVLKRELTFRNIHQIFMHKMYTNFHKKETKHSLDLHIKEHA